jgi:TetR/AcrR family transcriptional regulator
MATTHSAKRLTGDERRAQLIDTAMDLFSRHGFNGTTTRAIANAAGVSEAIIFRFFPHKDDLYAAILERKSNQACTDAWVGELQSAAASGDDEAVIRTVVTHLIDHTRRDPVFTRLMLHSALDNHSFAQRYRDRHFAPVHLFLLDYVAERQRDGSFRAGDPHALVRAILGVPVHHGLVETLLPDRNIAFGDDAIDVYTAFILGGLRTVPSPAPPRNGPRPSVR